MKRFYNYLDNKLIKIVLKSGKTYEGVPIAITYADESEDGVDHITIEDKMVNNKFYGFSKDEIANILEIE